MDEPLQLLCTDGQLAELVDAYVKARRTSQSTRVNPLFLENLVVDHCRALGRVPHEPPSEVAARVRSRRR